MSLTHNWGYSSDTASASTVTMSVVPARTGFSGSKKYSTPERESRTNDNGNLELDELLSYECKDVNNVASYLSTEYPAPLKSGVQYVVRLDEQLQLTSSGDPTFKEVLPVVAYLTIRHPKSGEISSSDIETIFKRLIGACYKTESGVLSNRFGDLMRGNTEPEEDGANAPT